MELESEAVLKLMYLDCFMVCCGCHSKFVLLQVRINNIYFYLRECRILEGERYSLKYSNCKMVVI